MGRVFYKDLILDIETDVYEPREDSFLLADNLTLGGNEKVLDLGTGSGILAIIAAKQNAKVVAVDLNEKAAECAGKNAELNKVSAKIEFRQGDLFNPVKEKEKFDVILFNFPYLPAEKKYSDMPIDLSYSNKGVMQKFLLEYKNYLAENGFCLIINSSLSGISIKGKTIAEKKLAFEKISLLRLE